MQIAGIACERCATRIVTESDGCACRACRVVYHRRCLTEPSACERCRANLQLLDAIASEDRQRELTAQRDRGRRIVVTVIALLMVGPLLRLAQDSARLASDPWTGTRLDLVQEVALFLLDLAICAALYFGSPGIRGFLRVLTLLGSVLNGLGAWKAALESDRWLASARLLDCAVLATLFWALSCSRDVEAFLRRRPES
jgi:hypothetical protein